MVLAAADETLRLDASFIDYALVAAYFAVVLLIGFAARRRVSDSLDFFLSGRSLPAWVTGLAFISASEWTSPASSYRGRQGSPRRGSWELDRFPAHSRPGMPSEELIRHRRDAPPFLHLAFGHPDHEDAASRPRGRATC